MSRISRALGLDGDSVTAVLGPTNTGKTHRAIQRMLRHPTGMIGLPLRLLAREVYDRVVAEAGADRVALVTGEEKRIPANPRFFVCTVEAMPLDRAVSFVAIDEIQLAADRTRGHVFTDRLLHARGLQETMFLGSDTIEPLLKRLLPDIVVEHQPRLSQLTWAGTSKLTAMPKRAAVVSFSVEGVYALADRLRARHGGVAVVVGALSPRTRNAQVDLFQSGEVPYLVATDAIGMGLNLDLDHVSFSELGKYDGLGYRTLSPSELAQIAGRAGRYRRDGTFGALNDLGDLDADLIDAIEHHHFEPLHTLFWRNTDLDFSSPEHLLGSLGRRPPQPFLLKMRDAVDHETLVACTHRPEVVERATDPARVALLWEVCQVPDFRKTLTGSHGELLAQVYCQLVDDGALAEDWVAARIERLDRVEGDIGALTTRLAYVRTWSFLCHRRGWIARAAEWQDRTREIEDRLSDALHEALIRRFVDRRAMVLKTGVQGEGLVDEHGVVRIGGDRVGALHGLTLHVEPSVRQDKALLKAVRAALHDELDRRVAALAQDTLTLDPDGCLRWGGVVGRWQRGASVLRPQVRQRRHDLLSTSARQGVGQALLAWTERTLGPLRAAFAEDPLLSPAARALLHALASGLGAVARSAVPADELTEQDRLILARRSVRFGQDHIFVLDLLKPGPVALKSVLHALWTGRPALAPPEGGATSVPATGTPAQHLALGYRVMGPRAVRLDIAERVAARLRRLGHKARFALPEDVLSWLGCTREELVALLVAQGFEVRGDQVLRPRARSAKPPGKRPGHW